MSLSIYSGRTSPEINYLFITENEEVTEREESCALSPRLAIKIQDTVMEVFQSEIVFGSAYSAKPILASYGAGPCVILSGYDPVHKVGFLAHFSHADEVIIGAKAIYLMVQKYLKHLKTNFHITLKGGIISDPISQKTLIAIHQTITSFSHPSIAFKILSAEHLLSEESPSQSLSLDLRSGSFQAYDPLVNNPLHYRKLTVEDIFWAQHSFERSAQLKVYVI